MNSFNLLNKKSITMFIHRVKPYCQSALDSLKQVQMSKKALMIVSLPVILVLVGGSWLMFKHQPATQTPNLASIRFNIEHNTLSALGETLNGVSSNIARIEKELQTGKSASHININQLTRQLNAIEMKVNGATAASQSALSNEITHSTQALKSQLSSINQQLKSLQDKQSHVKQLPVSALLFKVLYIENIQGNAVVTLSYNHTTFPLMVGETFQGFRLSQADYGQQKAVFTNKKHQAVIVTLNSAQSKGVHNG